MADTQTPESIQEQLNTLIEEKQLLENSVQSLQNSVAKLKEETKELEVVKKNFESNIETIATQIEEKNSELDLIKIEVDEYKKSEEILIKKRQKELDIKEKELKDSEEKYKSDKEAVSNLKQEYEDKLLIFAKKEEALLEKEKDIKSAREELTTLDAKIKKDQNDIDVSFSLLERRQKEFSDSQEKFITEKDKFRIHKKFIIEKEESMQMDIAKLSGLERSTQHLSNSINQAKGELRDNALIFRQALKEYIFTTGIPPKQVANLSNVVKKMTIRTIIGTMSEDTIDELLLKDIEDNIQGYAD